MLYVKTGLKERTRKKKTELMKKRGNSTIATTKNKGDGVKNSKYRGETEVGEIKYRTEHSVQEIYCPVS